LHFQHFGAMQTFLCMISGEEHFRAAKAPERGLDWERQTTKAYALTARRSAQAKHDYSFVWLPLTDQFLRQCRQISNPRTTTKRRMRSSAGLYKSVIRRGADTPIRSST
jgi:hypothetical protein